MDRLRGPLGRAAGGVLQRADRPQHEGPVAPPDRVVAGLARPRLRGAGGRRLRHGGDRPVLQRGRQGLEGARPAASQPGADGPRARVRFSALHRVRGRSRDLAAGGAAAARASALVGPDHLGLGRDVRPSPEAVSRDRSGVDPARVRSPCCSGSCSAWSISSARYRSGRGYVRLPRARDRHDAHAARSRLVQAATACALVEIDAGRRSARSPPTGSRFVGSGPCSARSHSSCSCGWSHRNRVPVPGGGLARRALVPAAPLSSSTIATASRPFAAARGSFGALDPHRVARRRQRRLALAPGRSSALC